MINAPPSDPPLEPVDVGGDLGGLDGATLVEVNEATEVCLAGQQNRSRRGAVATGSAGLLVVGLDAGRDRPVPDRTHIGLVDAHPEGVGCDDDFSVAMHEAVLRRGAFVRRHSGVVADHDQPGLGKDPGQLVGVLAGSAVDDRGPVRRVAEAVLEQGQLAALGALAFQLDDVEAEVRPVEARADGDRVVQSEAALDLLGDFLGCRCCAGHHRRPTEPLDRLREPQVVGAEVVAPLGQAVRLVDREEIDATRLQGVPEARGAKALRGAVDDSGLAVADRIHRLAGPFLRQAGGEHHRRVPGADEPLPLVGHQRDQRADDDRQIAAGDARELVAEALASAGRHHDERVTTGKRSLDGLELTWPEGSVAEVGEQRVRIDGAVVDADGRLLRLNHLIEPLQRQTRLRLMKVELLRGYGSGHRARVRK